MGELFESSHANSQDRIYQSLSTDGAGGGTINAIGNYSGAATDFYIAPPTGEVYAITRMIVHIEDAGNFSANGYGAGAILTNGIVVAVTDSVDAVLEDLTAGFRIYDNSGWGTHCYDIDYVSFGTGNNALNVRWTFAASGAPIILKDRERLKVTLNDDFSGLVEHHFVVQGKRGNLVPGTTQEFTF